MGKMVPVNACPEHSVNCLFDMQRQDDGGKEHSTTCRGLSEWNSHRRDLNEENVSIQSVFAALSTHDITLPFLLENSNDV